MLENIKQDNININHLLIKYDNGFLIKANKITIKKSKQSTPLPASVIVEIANKVFFFLNFVKEIEIKNIWYDNYHLSALYQNKELLILQKDIILKVSFSMVADKIVIDLKNLHYKPQKIDINAKIFFKPTHKEIVESLFFVHSKIFNGSGILKSTKENAKLILQNSNINYQNISLNTTLQADIDLINKKIKSSGNIKTLGIKSNFQINADEKQADIYLTNAHTKSLQKLLGLLKLNKNTSKWIYGNIIAHNYYIHNLYLPIDIKQKKPILKKLQLSANLERATVKFNDKLPPAKASKISINLDNERLDFRAYDSKYKNISLDLNGSLNNLFTHPILTINLASKTTLNDTIKHILKTYDVSLGNISQTKGKNNSYFKLTLDLKNPKNHIFLDTSIKDASFLLSNIKLDSKKAKIVLQDKQIELKDVNLKYKKIANLEISGNIDLEQKKIKSYVFINSLILADGDALKLNNKKIDLSVDFNKTLTINSKNLNLHIKYKDDLLEGNITSIKPLIKSSNLMKMFDIKDANVSFKKTKKSLEAIANVYSSGISLMQNNKQIKNFKIEYLKKDDIESALINDNITIELKEKEIDVSYDGIDINISAMLKKYQKGTKRRKAVEKKIKPKQDNAPSKAIMLYATNSNLIYNGRIIPSDFYMLYNKADRLSFELDYNKTEIKAEKEYNNITIRAKNINDEFVKKLFKFKMQNGKANFLVHGNLKTKEFYGTLTIKDTVVRGYALINNIIAFVNTVPSLVTLRNPGFDLDGYEIKKGVIEFFADKDRLYLNTIRFVGVNTDIFGYGQVDLKTNNVDLVLTLSTIKSLSNLLGKIPLIGYALLGEDKTIGTMISVKGPLKNPKVETTFAKNSLLYPFSVIKRTLMWPFKLFEDDSKKWLTIVGLGLRIMKD